MKKRKFGQAALDAIDAEIEAWTGGGGDAQTRRELRAIRRVIVAAGKADISSHKPTGIGIDMDLEDMRDIARVILNARDVESKRA